MQTYNHDIHATKEQFSRQNSAAELPFKIMNIKSVDDLIMSTTSTLPFITAPRRNSLPSLKMSAAVRFDAQRERLEDSFSQFLIEHQLRSIELDYEGPPIPATYVPPVYDDPPPPYTPNTPSPVDNSICCLICTNDLPSKRDPEHFTKVVWPCRQCEEPYCTSCIKDMFIEACRDSMRMPPRCCGQVNLHHALPYLTTEETKLFRAKYEEWSTPHPFYCPVPTCSAFIPERQLAQKGESRRKGKRRVDSCNATPTEVPFACPTCENSICFSCRQVAHPGSNCELRELGVDSALLTALKRWGYKQCPNCSHGVRRMHGCRDMQCRCGARFCWTCLRDINDGECECADEDYSDDEYSDDEDEEAGNQQSEENQAEEAPNLDAGRADEWEAGSLDFGEEPSSGYAAMLGCCHTFETYTISLAEALTSHHTRHDLECAKCWTPIHPEILPPDLIERSGKEIIVPAHSTRNFRPAGIHRRNSAYAFPRGLSEWNGINSTADNSLPSTTTETETEADPEAESSTSTPAQEDDNNDEKEKEKEKTILDTYGTPIPPSSRPLTRRASITTPLDPSIYSAYPALNPTQIKQINPENELSTQPNPPFQLAYECNDACLIVVCATCRDKMLEMQNFHNEDSDSDSDSDSNFDSEDERKEEEDTDDFIDAVRGLYGDSEDEQMEDTEDFFEAVRGLYGDSEYEQQKEVEDEDSEDFVDAVRGLYDGCDVLFD